jgi:predicted nucleic acid-binding protein
MDDIKEERELNVFLDSSVILSFVRGERNTLHLFDNRITSKYHYYVSPVVTQEVLHSWNLTQSRTGNPQAKLERALSNVEILNLKEGPWEIVSARLNELRNELSHSNDYLNLLTAVTACDVFVTLDRKLLEHKTIDHLRIIDPVELLKGEHSR